MSRISFDFFFHGTASSQSRVVAADRGLRRHRRHEFQALSVPGPPSHGLPWTSRRWSIFFFQLVDFVLLAASEFFLNGLELFRSGSTLFGARSICRFTRVLMLRSTLSFFELDLQDVADAIQPLDGGRRFSSKSCFSSHRKLQVLRQSYPRGAPDHPPARAAIMVS